MAHEDHTVLTGGITRRGWFGAALFSAVIILLVAVGATDSVGWLTLIILVATFGATGFFLWLFPGSRFFVLTFANSLAIYTSIYLFLRQANFDAAAGWAVGVGYLSPIYVFMVGVWLQRESIRKLSHEEEMRRRPVLGHKFMWIIPMTALSILTFSIPRIGFEAGSQSVILVVAMGVVSGFVGLACRQISLFLIDTGLIFDHFFIRIGRLFRPAFAFLTLYSFIVIVFAMVFRIMDRLSPDPIFLIDARPAPIGFTESLYFSLITMSTVGYGDITPADEAVRIAAAIEVVLGILLFLFGFAEIMRYAREPVRHLDESND